MGKWIDRQIQKLNRKIDLYIELKKIYIYIYIYIHIELISCSATYIILFKCTTFVYPSTVETV